MPIYIYILFTEMYAIRLQKVDWLHLCIYYIYILYIYIYIYYHCTSLATRINLDLQHRLYIHIYIYYNYIRIPPLIDNNTLL